MEDTTYRDQGLSVRSDGRNPIGHAEPCSYTPGASRTGPTTALDRVLASSTATSRRNTTVSRITPAGAFTTGSRQPD